MMANMKIGSNHKILPVCSFQHNSCL